jgi:rhomboid family protein
MIPIRDTIKSQRTPVMTWLIILANAVVFAHELRLTPEALERFLYLCGMVPARYSDPKWAAYVGFPAGLDLWPFLTCMFLHGGWVHILSNLWVLWIFGDNVEDRMGPARYLIFYLLCGLAAGAVHYFTNPRSEVPTIGASGAIAGVMGAYLVLFPRSRVVTIVPLLFWPLFFEVPALVFLGFWFLSQFFSGAMALADSEVAGGIAWWAHVGGFLAGIALLPIFARRRPRPAQPA